LVECLGQGDGRFVLRHKRYGSQMGDLYSNGGKYMHPQSANADGSYVKEDTSAVMWEGRDNFNAIALRVKVHPVHGNYNFLITHGLQQDQYLRVLKCTAATGTRNCVNSGYGPVHPNAELVLGTVPSLSGLDPTDADQMTAATAEVGFKLLYNSPDRGWAFNDDDGSFLIMHTQYSYIVTPETGGSEQRAISNGEKLVWRKCPTNCINDFDREDYLTWGFVFETEMGRACLPAGA